MRPAACRRESVLVKQQESNNWNEALNPAKRAGYSAVPFFR
jgi:hypothetical protein